MRIAGTTAMVAGPSAHSSIPRRPSVVSGGLAPSSSQPCSVKSPMIRIETVRAKDLATFSDNFLRNAANQTMAPISPHRAVSQANNPCADDTDIGLIVAFCSDRCVGYCGALPGMLEDRDRKGKLYYGTGLYVDPELRKSGLAFELVGRLIGLGRDVVTTDYTRLTAIVCGTLGFKTFSSLRYICLTPQRGEGGQCLAAGVPNATRYWAECVRAASARYGDVEVCEVSNLPEEWRPAARETRPRFYRGNEVLKWMLRHPWVVDDRPPTTPPYYFADTRPYFRYMPIEISKGGRRLGWLILCISMKGSECLVKLLDFEVDSFAAVWAIFGVVCTYAKRVGAGKMILPIEMEQPAGSAPFASTTMSIQERLYACHRTNGSGSVLPADLSTIALHLADGDTAFY
jgi:GNAT superfamily N-acetyltransferase